MRHVTSRRRGVLLLVSSWLFWIMVTSTAHAQMPSTAALRTTEHIVLDGRLEEAAWRISRHRGDALRTAISLSRQQVAQRVEH
jgi:hypothetical protein